MRIRVGDVHDWPFIYALGKTVILDSVSPWRRQPASRTLNYRIGILKGLWTWIQQSDSIAFVAETEDDQGGPVKAGYLILFPGAKEELTGLSQGWVMDLAVSKEFRGRGVGSALLKAAEDHCRAARIPYLGLAVSSHNIKALSLYEKLGFAEERKLMVKVLSAD
ncbi:mycothiol acetyltransferase [Peptococcaceae bacterium CEB3]|nr:mycothiol acetyltransferase [Peptococcaceae bacterium CEB3]